MSFSLLSRIVIFLILAGIWYSGFWLVAGVFTLWYLFRYVGYEVVVLGLFLDVQYMTGDVPWYTLAFTLSLLFIEWLKPQLLAYTD